MKNNASSIKFLQFGLTLILALLCVSGCGNTNSGPTPDPTQEAIMNTPFSIRVAMSVAIRKADMTRMYGKPNITRKQKGYSYEVRVLWDGSKLFILYDSQDIVIDMWRLKKLFEQRDFDKIVTRKSVVADVKKIDPYFQILEYADNQETTVSEHRMKDGGLLTISYKKFGNEWVVDSVVYTQEDPSGFAAKILPEDLPKDQ